MKKPTMLDVLLLVQRELRQYHARDKESQALIELKTKILELQQPKKETRILVTIEGGICQSVMSNKLKNVRVVVVDYDLKGDEPVIVSEQNLEKLKFKNFYEIFNDTKDAADIDVKYELTRLKF